MTVVVDTTTVKATTMTVVVDMTTVKVTTMTVVVDISIEISIAKKAVPKISYLGPALFI